MDYIRLTIYKEVDTLHRSSKKSADSDKTTSAYMADKRHGDVYTVVSCDIMMTIPRPKHCGQNWLEMTPTDSGRICGQCSKNIIDFSKMSWTEIEQVQKQNNNSVCGMYNPKQLDYWGKEIPTQTHNFKRIIAITSLTVSLTTNAYSQVTNKDSLVITGRVIDTETNEPLPFASLTLRNNKTGASTDFEGNFKLIVRNIPDNPIPDTLEVKYVGYISRQIIFNDLKEIQKQNDIGLEDAKLELTMTPDTVYVTNFYVTKPTLKEKIKWKFKKWFGRKEK